MRKYFFAACYVTGQTPGYSSMSKDDVAFPCRWLEDVFAEGCLDAPLYIPTGQTKVPTKSPMGLACFEVRPGTYSHD